MQIAITLQRLLEYVLTFQLPQEQAENPFLTPYEGILNLERNLTHFALNHRTEKTYERYENLLDTHKQQLNTEKMQILQTDSYCSLTILPLPTSTSYT